MNYIKINQLDNVMVALVPLQKGEKIEGIVLKSNIPAGHKFSISPINKNENIIKYGSPIGFAKEDIKVGDHVHVHNIKTNLDGLLNYNFTPVDVNILKESSKTFKGYRRSNQKVGIRNEIVIIPTVGCVNGTATIIAKSCEKYKFKGVDGVYSYNHPYGCSQLGTDHEYTRTILADLVNHPNVGGALVLGLGCENNTVEQFKLALGNYDKSRIKFLVTQESSNEEVEGENLIKEIAKACENDKREETSVSDLVIGLKCGGSDGLSGITANPLVGAFSDKLIGQGGSTILTEVPEMFGAETILMNRCIDDKVFDKTVTLINDFKNYFIRYNQEIYENPSPGNKDGGISTLEDKSLGCTQKSGVSKVVDVLKYGELIKTKGLNLLNAPGNDLVASTALSASGAHIVLFTTGRGTPFGSFVPTIKISSNSDLFNRKSNWIDFNAGVLVEGVNMTDLCNDFFDYIIKVASGDILTKTEEKNIRDIAIFKDGVTL